MINRWSIKLTLCSVLSFVSLWAISDGSPNPLSDVDSLQWHHRIVIVDNKTKDNELPRRFKNQQFAIDDRDIVWFIIEGDTILTNYSNTLATNFLTTLRDQFRLKTSEVVLVGKDGGVKYRANHVDLDEIFARIDAMPMRQYEMGIHH